MTRVQEMLVILFCAAVAIFLLFSMTAHGAVGKQHGNSLGTVMYTGNPMTYKAGAVTAVSYLVGGKGLVIRMQPIGTYGLFTEDILICGTPVEKFLDKSNPMVLTYRTIAHRMVDEIGCHELVSVNSLKPKEALQ